MAMETLCAFTIEGLPPSANHTYAPGRGCVYKKPEAKKWTREAVDTIKKQCGVMEHNEHIVTVMLRFYTKNKRKMDIDNRVKILQDCLMEAGVIKDDSQVWDLAVRRILTPGEPEMTRVIVSTYES